MVEEVIEGRYTTMKSVLEDRLTAWYGAGNFKIIVSGSPIIRLYRVAC